MSPAVFAFAHPDDETLAAGVAIVEHVAAGQDVHLLLVTRGGGSAVLDELNGTVTDSWWGVAHTPAHEGYEPLTVEQFEQARFDEYTVAKNCLASGLPGTLTLHEAGLANDGSMTMVDAYEAILAACDEIAPGEPVRLKGHTWVTELDTHPDHIAVGAAIKQLGIDLPTRFGDRRHYLLPQYWASPHLNLVSEVWDNPSNAGVAARARNACRAYGAWAPPHRFAIGHHSTYAYFAQVLATPKCLFHS